MTPNGLDAAADAAMAAALADLPDGADTAASDPWDDTPVEGTVVDGTQLAVTPDTNLQPCTREEAEALVEKARGAITTLTDTMWEIIHRQAWVPLGYDSPQQFFVKEFADQNSGGMSKVHAYRVARVIGFLYGLYERLGDDAEAVDITERALRAIPRGRDGINDVALLDSITDALGDDYTVADVQKVVNDQVKAAREKFKPAPADTPDLDQLAERLRALQIDPSVLTGMQAEQDDWDSDDGDEHPEGHSHDGGKTFHHHDDDPSDSWEDPPTVKAGIGASSGGGVTLDTHTSPDAAYGAAKDAATAATAIATLAGLTDQLDQMIGLFTPAEIDQLPAWAAALRACADALDGYEHDIVEIDINDM